MITQGIFTFKNGNKYQGYFSSGRFNSSGDLFFTKQKIKYSGNFKDGEREGLGCQFEYNTLALYYGFWKNDNKSGPAIEIIKDNKVFTIWDKSKQVKVFSNRKEFIDYCTCHSTELYKKATFLLEIGNNETIKRLISK